MPAIDHQSKRHVSLVIPGLLGPKSSANGDGTSEWPPTPALELLLARADKQRVERSADFETMIFELFDIDVDAEHDLPVAAVTRALDLGVIDKGWWLRADPVHLRADRNRLILADNKVLGITQDEADGLVSEIMEVYAEDGWVLKAARPDRWYLKPTDVPKLNTVPLPAVIGRDINDCLPRGEDYKIWHTILNEVQILLHTAKTNVERERRGALPINSVWFWGGGRLPELKHTQWSHVWSGEPVSLALARLSQTLSKDVPDSAEDWLDSDNTPGQHLVVLDQGREAIEYGAVDEWHRFVATIENNWIAPLVAGLHDERMSSVSILLETGERFHLNAKATRRWWRRRRPLQRYR
ncbi:MAG: hypothetical protein E2O38_09410 [Proteobacteria bacterium]|nr:MAG: hypothetical protein E2O38_09410 [Pseudomonadota bacterium]